ncbi:MAG: YceH family protein [Gammaproteobacteria bacterium]
MAFALTANELRVIGALLEKQVTTPDQYPLTLKSLTSACNQKSNREPVMQMAESDVRETVALLEKQYLVSLRTEYGSRVSKHRQRFCNSEFGPLKFDPAELALVCMLMLRGPQTPGELRSRSGRLHEFPTVDDVNETLETLAKREDGPFVVRLNRQPGRRDARYAHLLGVDDPEAATDEAPPPSAPSQAGASELEARVSALEETVAQLKKELGID